MSRSRIAIERNILQTAFAQGGVIGRGQALALGFTSDQIKYRLRTGAWVRQPGDAYRLVEPGDRRALLWGAVLGLRGAVVSHQSAAELHTIPMVPAEPVSVTVHASAAHRLPGVKVHRTRDLAEHHIERRAGLPVTTLIRTVFDLAGVLHPRLFEQVVDELIAARRLRVADIAEITDELARRGKRGSALIKTVLAERSGIPAVTFTVIERKGRSVLLRGGLPHPHLQFPIPWAPHRRFDAAYPRAGVGIEWDSRRWHTRRADFERDRRRDREALAHGWVVVRVTWAELVGRPDMVVDDIRRLLEARTPREG